MNNWKRIILAVILVAMMVTLSACSDANQHDRNTTEQIARTMAERQPTPSDITYSLSRYNLIRRTYYLAGEFEKAKNLPCEVRKPLGYIYLFVEGVGCVLTDSVDGIVTSMRSYLTPDSEYYSAGSGLVDWLADIDGTYGDNPDGIFYFDVNGEYHEWTGLYYYSQNYYPIDDPVIKIVQQELEAAN